ncbi:hypothetical protein [Bosea sp. ANAM02]|uniref:hypothetical protein n=1 Tax=Bosea sp. ANAM02 TaxID=2020412 RepID=UPI00140EDFFF|nr:hypothetical protein [Bosea sp. ANAM02]BCB22007.1 hypothetical protein OCUBac02_49010 [Bosea sp. ANAM02]
MIGFASSIPAWRIKQLRTYLIEVAQRALTAGDDGVDLEHRAARRRFLAARARALPVGKPGKRTFPQEVVDEIWKELVPSRQVGLATKDIHARVSERCLKLGLRPPSITTIHSWRWHICPKRDADRLGLTDLPLPLGDTVAIGEQAYRVISHTHGDVIEAPVLTDNWRPWGKFEAHVRSSLAFREPGLNLWWQARPSLEESYQTAPDLNDRHLEWYLGLRGGLEYELFCERLRDAYWQSDIDRTATSRDLGKALLQFRQKVLPFVIPIKPPPPADADSDFARSLADIVIGAYAAARTAPGGAIDLDAVIKWRLNGKQLKATAA